jgi:hypothetical protein
MTSPLDVLTLARHHSVPPPTAARIVKEHGSLIDTSRIREEKIYA